MVLFLVYMYVSDGGLQCYDCSPGKECTSSILVFDHETQQITRKANNCTGRCALFTEKSRGM